jgi:predicted metal-dependent enzyme (double-stranded beta helix superfamily)
MAIEPSENVGTRLLFENDRVRVWDLALAPGESVGKHIHRLDYLLLIVNGGSLRHVDPEHPENDRDVHFEDDRVMFNEANGGKIHDELVNVGTEPYRNFVIEFKQ